MADPVKATSENQKKIIALLGGRPYVLVPSSSEALELGSAGAEGDEIESVFIVPETTSPGAVTLIDGVGDPIVIFAGGADSVGTLIPFSAVLGVTSTDAGWRISTGANVHALVIGRFTDAEE